jgi:nicotinate phosphoribosyltransferase
MGVSADAPSLDSAYKLVEYDGRPMLKLSKAKVTEPGRKQVFRGKPGDVIGLRDEPLLDGHEPLLVPVMSGGRRTGPQRTLESARTLFRTDLERVPADAARIEDPVAPTPLTSEALDRLADDAKADALKRAGLP